MIWVYIVLAMVIGMCLSIQAAVNSRLPFWIGHPIRSALASFAVGTAVLLVVSVILRAPWPSPTRLATAPWWTWTGGLLGAGIVAGTIVAAPKLGGAVLAGVVVLGQLLCALVLDHYGLFGFPKHALTPLRALGAALLVAGVVLIRRY